DDVVAPPDAQVDRAHRHRVRERREPVAHVLGLGEDVEDELERGVERSSRDDLELARELDHCGSMAVRCHGALLLVALSGSRPSDRVARRAPARTWPTTRAAAAGASARGDTAGTGPPPGS